MSALMRPPSSVLQAEVRAARATASELIDGWQSSRPLDARSLLAEHSSLARVKSIVIDLAYEEYCQRRDRGEPIDAEQFVRQFPSARSSLRRLLQVDSFIEHVPEWQALRTTEPDWPGIGESWLGFQLVDVLGRGAFSRVFLARELALGDRYVVVKATRLGRGEARMQGPLQHPHIVPVHSVQHDAKRALTAVCLPFLGRATLGDILDAAPASDVVPRTAAEILAAVAREQCADDPLPARQAAWNANWTYVDGVACLLEQVAEALVHTHARGVLHQDIKPSNILVTGDGQALLFDFNLATTDGQKGECVGGTLPYMAPEQLQAVLDPGSGSTIDCRADLFSLAATFYEILTGQAPFRNLPTHLSQKQAAALILERQRSRALPIRALNPQVPSELAALLEQCLAVDPHQRVDSAAEFVARMQRCRRREIHAPGGVWKTRLARWWPYATVSLALGAVLLAGATGGTPAPSVVREESSSPQPPVLPAPAGVEMPQRELEIERLFVLVQQKKWTEAITLAARLDEEAHDTRVYELWGYAAACEAKQVGRPGDWPWALDIHERGIHDGCSSPTLRNNAAYCLMFLGFDPTRTARAETHLRAALAEDPHLSQAWHNLLSLQPYLTKVLGQVPDPEVARHALETCDPSPRLWTDAAHVLGEASLREPDPVRKEQLQRELRTVLDDLVARDEPINGTLFHLANQIFPGEFHSGARPQAAPGPKALLVAPERPVRR